MNYPKSIEEAAKCLDTYFGGPVWVEKISRPINMGQLNNCILGQTIGYFSGMEHIFGTKDTNGYLVDKIFGCRANVTDWEKEIQKRKEAMAVPQKVEETQWTALVLHSMGKTNAIYKGDKLIIPGGGSSHIDLLTAADIKVNIIHITHEQQNAGREHSGCIWPYKLSSFHAGLKKLKETKIAALEKELAALRANA